MIKNNYPLQASIRYGLIGIAPSFSDRSFAGSIIIKSSIFATEFLTSACNIIFLAHIFPSIFQSFHQKNPFIYFLIKLSKRNIEQIILAYLLPGSTTSHVLTGFQYVIVKVLIFNNFEREKFETDYAILNSRTFVINLVSRRLRRFSSMQ